MFVDVKWHSFCVLRMASWMTQCHRKATQHNTRRRTTTVNVPRIFTSPPGSPAKSCAVEGCRAKSSLFVVTWLCACACVCVCHPVIVLCLSCCGTSSVYEVVRFVCCEVLQARRCLHAQPQMLAISHNKPRHLHAGTPRWR